MENNNPSESIAIQIREVAKKALSEEDLRFGVEQILSNYLSSLGIKRTARYERSTFSGGSADSVYGHVVIEYKKPGKLSEKNSIKNITNQLARYLIDFAKESGGTSHQEEALEKMVGVGLDGNKIVFLRYSSTGRKRSSPLPPLPETQTSFFEIEGFAEDNINGGFQIIGPANITKESINLLFLFLRSLSRKLLSPETLTASLGPQSEIARNFVNSFVNALRSAEQKPKVATFFGEWKRIFGIVYGAELDNSKNDLDELTTLYGINNIRRDELLHVFFSVHTYYALLMKLLAIELASLQSGAFVGSIVSDLIVCNEQEMFNKLEFLENGGAFSVLGINNFLEGDFFSWYLDIWDSNLCNSIQSLAHELSDFEPATSTLEPEYTRDLLKKLYQYLVPKKFRHDLGEYFTPDWLAERLLNQVGYHGEIDKRIIDPSCGSGTFPILALKRLRQYAADHVIEPPQLLEAALTNIVGFDLNPLSVIAARTNYLLALGDLLRYRKGNIDIPVYLCDSVLTPVEQDTLFGKNFTITTVVGNFVLPGELVKTGQIPKLCSLIEFCVHNDYSVEQFLRRVKMELSLDMEQSVHDIQELFSKFRLLEHESRNGIWARFIKNAFAPMLVGKFDYVVGNPPWVNWESLSDEYRNSTKHLWVEYGLFTLKGHAARLGGGKKDLSMLFTYASADKYLKSNGKLGFVITQTVFQTKGAGDGFRRFRLGGNELLKAQAVDDMVKVQPFEGAINWTAVLILQKGQTTKYPVTYNVWSKVKGAKTNIDDTLEAVIAKTSRVEFKAQPVDLQKITSPWRTFRPGQINLVNTVLGKSEYKARAGACTWADGIYWMRILNKRPDGLVIIENIPELAKRDIQKIQAVIEPNLLYPFLQWKSIKRFTTKSDRYILMVQDPNTRSGYDENFLKVEYPHTYSYLKHFESILRSRSGFRKYFDTDKDPFYSMYNISSLTYSPYKVIWKTMGNSIDSVVLEEKEDELLGRKCLIHKNTVYSVGLTNRTEAHYLCAILNSRIVTYVAKSYSVSGGKSFGTGIFDFIAIPKYDSSNLDHEHLAQLSIRAHELAEKRKDTSDLEIEINAASLKIWSMDENDLKEINTKKNTR